MSLVVGAVDNCGDTYGVADVETVGWTGSAESIVAGRAGGGALRLSGGTIITPDQLQRNAALGTDFTWHCGLMVESTPGSDTVLVRFYEGSTMHVDVRITSSRTLRITRNGTTLATGTAVLTLGVFYQFAIHLKIADGAAGEIHTWVDNAGDITTGAGFDTRNGGTAGSIDSFMIRGQFGFAVRYDDIVGYTGNDHKGFVRIVAPLPRADGAHSDFTPKSAGDHFEEVNDATPDADTSYVSSDTGGFRDSYEMNALGVDPSATVYAVVGRMIARRLDLGARILALFVRPTTTDFDGADQGPAYGYTMMSEVWETDPQAVAAWTVATVDANELGVLDNTP